MTGHAVDGDVFKGATDVAGGGLGPDADGPLGDSHVLEKDVSRLSLGDIDSGIGEPGDRDVIEDYLLPVDNPDPVCSGAGPLNGEVADDYFVRRQVGGDVDDDARSPGVENGCQGPIAVKGDGFGNVDSAEAARVESADFAVGGGLGEGAGPGLAGRGAATGVRIASGA